MTPINAPVLGRMLRPMVRSLRVELLQALAALQPSPVDEQRYHELAEKNAESSLSADENLELDGMVSSNTFLSLLRREAREALANRG